MWNMHTYTSPCSVALQTCSRYKKLDHFSPWLAVSSHYQHVSVCWGHHNNYWWCPQSQTITHSVNYWQRDNPSELENKDHHQFDSEYSSHSVGSSFILVYLSGLWSLSCSSSFFSYSFLSFFLLLPSPSSSVCIIVHNTKKSTLVEMTFAPRFLCFPVYVLSSRLSQIIYWLV